MTNINKMNLLQRVVEIPPHAVLVGDIIVDDKYVVLHYLTGEPCGYPVVEKIEVGRVHPISPPSYLFHLDTDSFSSIAMAYFVPEGKNRLVPVFRN